jgi:hypothetical protein
MTLTELNKKIQKLAPFAIALFAILFVSLYGLSHLWKSFQQKQRADITIDSLFGTIPTPQVRQSLPFPAQPRFLLDTVEGSPITATPAAQVFFIPKERTRFGYLETMYLMAKTLGFDTETLSHSLENNIGIFSQGTRELRVDTQTFNFTYVRTYDGEETLFEDSTIPSKERIETISSDLLRKLGSYHKIFSEGASNLTYLKYDPQTKDVETLPSSRGANMVEIDYFQPDLQGIKVVTEKYYTSSNHLVFAFPAGEPILLKGEISVWEWDKSNAGIYSLINGDEAWNRLQKKQAIIVANQNPSSTIKIESMYLAYLEPSVYQPYFQPVYVFQGVNNFIAYVPAVKQPEEKQPK